MSITIRKKLLGVEVYYLGKKVGVIKRLDNGRLIFVMMRRKRYNSYGIPAEVLEMLKECGVSEVRIIVRDVDGEKLLVSDLLDWVMFSEERVFENGEWKRLLSEEHMEVFC